MHNANRPNRRPHHTVAHLGLLCPQHDSKTTRQQDTSEASQKSGLTSWKPGLILGGLRDYAMTPWTDTSTLPYDRVLEEPTKAQRHRRLRTNESLQAMVFRTRHGLPTPPLHQPTPPHGPHTAPYGLALLLSGFAAIRALHSPPSPPLRAASKHLTS